MKIVLKTNQTCVRRRLDIHVRYRIYFQVRLLFA